MFGRLVLQFSSVAFALLVQQTLAKTCERINTSILEGCDQIGYIFTAKFPDVRGEDYQTFIEPQVSMLNNLLANCSSHSKLIVCSRHVPKCAAEDLEPMLPCREVCENFVADCSSVLQNNGMRRLYSALCDLLPAQDAGDAPSCIRPEGFSPKVSIKEEAIPQCKNVTAPACQTGNYTLLPNGTNTRLQASLVQRNSSCSPRAEEFACYTHSAPCYSNEGKALFPCRALCEEIQRDCGRPNHVPFSSCFFDFPDGNSTSGLCELDTWYVPKWPRLQVKVETKERVSVKPTSTSLATTTKNNTGVVADSGTSAGVKAGIAVGVLLTLAAAGVAVFFVYKRYKANHTGVKLSHEKLSDLREIKGNANDGFVELHDSPASSTSASGGEKVKELDKNESDALSIEEPKKRKSKATVTFGGAVTVGGVEGGEGNGYIAGGFFSHDSALY